MFQAAETQDRVEEEGRDLSMTASGDQGLQSSDAEQAFERDKRKFFVRVVDADEIQPKTSSDTGILRPLSELCAEVRSLWPLFFGLIFCNAIS